jgi:N utilization substance protein B
VVAGRRSSRRQAAFILYQLDLLKLDVEAALGRVEDGEVGEYARRVVNGVEAERGRIDSVLGPHVTGWSLERLGVLERAILRVATYELLMETEVPVAVVINEAVNLAKRFCSGEAAALVNAVLAGIAAEVRASEGEERERPVGGP